VGGGLLLRAGAGAAMGGGAAAAGTGAAAGLPDRDPCEVVAEDGSATLGARLAKGLVSEPYSVRQPGHRLPQSFLRRSKQKRQTWYLCARGAAERQS